MGRRKKKNNYTELGDDDDDYAPPRHAIKKQNGRLNGPNLRNGRNRNKKVNDDDGFRKQLEEDGSKSVVEMAADGNCLFRALSDQLFYDFGHNHEEVRSDVCDYVQANEEELTAFLVLDEDEEDEDAANFEAYVSSMRENGNWGGHVELVAAAQLYRRNINVFSIQAAYTINHGDKKSGGPDLMVSFHDNDHYNSVRGTSAKKPPPPIKFMPQRHSETSMQTDRTEDESFESKSSILDKETDDPAKESADPMEICKPAKPSKSKKKKGKCPCGSGLSYRKCCRDRDKKQRAMRKSKQSTSAMEVEETANKKEAEGSFKVRKI